MNKVATKSSPKQRSPVSPARLAAFEILRRVAEGGYASVLLAARAEELEPRDRALCHELVMGVLRFQLWLDRAIEHFAGRSVSQLDLPVALALRLGLYQLRFLARVPQSAAVNESVNLVHAARVRSAGSFVNAVLRRATREPSYDPAAEIKDPIERMSVSTSHPLWLIRRWDRLFGAREAEALAIANNQPAPLAFRVVRQARRSGCLAAIARVWRDRSNLLRSQTVPGEFRAEENWRSAWRVRAKSTSRTRLPNSSPKLLRPIQATRCLMFVPRPEARRAKSQSASDVRVIAGDKHFHRIKTVRSLFQSPPTRKRELSGLGWRIQFAVSRE